MGAGAREMTTQKRLSRRSYVWSLRRGNRHEQLEKKTRRRSDAPFEQRRDGGVRETETFLSATRLSLGAKQPEED